MKHRLVLGAALNDRLVAKMCIVVGCRLEQHFEKNNIRFSLDGSTLAPSLNEMHASVAFLVGSRGGKAQVVLSGLSNW